MLTEYHRRSLEIYQKDRMIILEGLVFKFLKKEQIKVCYLKATVLSDI